MRDHATRTDREHQQRHGGLGAEHLAAGQREHHAQPADRGEHAMHGQLVVGRAHQIFTISARVPRGSALTRSGAQPSTVEPGAP